MSEGAGSVKRGVTGASGGKKAAAKRTAKSTAAKKAATGRTAAGTAAGRTAAKSAAPTTTTRTTKAAAKKTAAGKTATAGTAAAKKTAAGKTAAKKASGRADKVGAASAAEQTGATTVVAKKTPGTATAGRSGVPKARLAAADPGELAVRPGEDPWNPEEVAEARAELQREADRLRAELDSSEKSLAGLMRDSGDGAGDDEADTGTKNITREHELALAANAREMLEQTEHALQRLDAGTYGLCENCGNPIGKARMQAFPRATLCVECKQKQERRY
ncbi:MULTISPECIES: TraR/DksA family transcriptional regulator [unclassified Streptomyces]|uniref:TraR/DksA family transcriptional regulator n=1 Tax=unclassified Streptomyces TaxID=2593676 RepID=UPI0037F4469D